MPRARVVYADEFDYSNVDANGKCSNSGERKPVFYSERELQHMCPAPANLQDSVSQCAYCTSTDLNSLESGDVHELYVRGMGSPYNFASLCTLRTALDILSRPRNLCFCDWPLTGL